MFGWAVALDLFFVKIKVKTHKKKPRIYRKWGNLQNLQKIFQKGIYK